MKEFNKLVRDRIPEIIEKNGQIAYTRILTDVKYKNALEEKLKEEVNEYISDNSIEELADILEVLDAIVQSSKYSWKEVMDAKASKREQKGGFGKRVFLLGRTE